jgi:hypothetical protein
MKNKSINYNYYCYVALIIILFYILSRYILGLNKNREGFQAIADTWYNISLFWYNLWYALLTFWKNAFNFWFNMFDYLFEEWKKYINYSTNVIKSTGSGFSNVNSNIFNVFGGGGGSNAPSGVYNTVSLMGNLGKIAKYS